MIFHFAGTGTSQGVPVIGCQCKVCLSTDKRDHRLRTAAFIESPDTNIAIDVGPDFRQQMLSVGANRLDAIFLTHEHNDHVAGLDDIRPFNYMQRSPLRIFALPRVAQQVRDRFSYVFAKNKYPGAPNVELVHLVPYKRVKVGSLNIMPFPVFHGSMTVLGFQIGSITYITDANKIPDRTFDLIRRTKFLVLNALHHSRHHSHFNLDQAIDIAKSVGAEMTYLVHVSHQMGLYEKVSKALPQFVNLAYDGLNIELK